MCNVLRVVFALTVNINFDCVDSQEIRRIVWNRKVHYCVDRNPPIFPIVKQK
jgi:hypothetical protein